MAQAKVAKGKGKDKKIEALKHMKIVKITKFVPKGKAEGR